jgi:hypothetical protein
VPEWFNPNADSKKLNWLDYDGITIIAENLEVNDQHFIFDVEIKNETDYRLRFDPEEVYYLGSNAPYPTDNRIEARISYESNLKKHYALSENAVARHFEQQIKSQKRTNLITGILSASLLVFDVAMGANGMTKEVSSKFSSQEAIRSMVTMGGLAAMDIVREQSAMTAQQAKADLQYLPDEIIEEGIIYPRQTFRGKVYMPSGREKFIRMVIPVESNEFALDFRWADGKDQRKLRRSY